MERECEEYFESGYEIPAYLQECLKPDLEIWRESEYREERNDYFWTFEIFGRAGEKLYSFLLEPTHDEQQYEVSHLEKMGNWSNYLEEGFLTKFNSKQEAIESLRLKRKCFAKNLARDVVDYRRRFYADQRLEVNAFHEAMKTKELLEELREIYPETEKIVPRAQDFLQKCEKLVSDGGHLDHLIQSESEHRLTMERRREEYEEEYNVSSGPFWDPYNLSELVCGDWESHGRRESTYEELRLHWENGMCLFHVGVDFDEVSLPNQHITGWFENLVDQAEFYLEDLKSSYETKSKWYQRATVADIAEHTSMVREFLEDPYKHLTEMAELIHSWSEVASRNKVALAELRQKWKKEYECLAREFHVRSYRTHEWLYRAYDADGLLLYVGISNAPLLRLKSHQSSLQQSTRVSKWFPQMDSYTLQPFCTREAVLEAEKKAILSEKPLYNIVLNKGNAKRLRG